MVCLKGGKSVDCVEPLVDRVLLEAGFACSFTQAAEHPPGYTMWAGWADREVKTVFDRIMVQGPVRGVRCLQLPAEQLVSRTNGLPSRDFPSDHLPIVVDLDLVCASMFRFTS